MNDIKKITKHFTSEKISYDKTSFFIFKPQDLQVLRV